MTKLKNENLFLELFAKHFGKKLQKAAPFWVNDSIQSSVDYILEHKGMNYLFEIDSYNMSKPLFGQYILTNDYFKKSNSQINIFIAIHFYKNFRKDRTIKYLQFAQDKLGCMLPFVVFESEEFVKEIKKHKDLDSFLTSIKKLSIN